MASTAQEAYDDISEHIGNKGNPYSDWYCGITEDIQSRLFGNHKVPKKGHWYIYRECTNSTVAREVEKALLNNGCDGGSGGGDEDAVYVYAYLKTSITEP